MTLPINNQVYTAAYAGALAGMGVGSRMLSASTGVAQLAGAWASSFDTAWNSATQIDQLQHDAIQSASQAAWNNQNPIVDTTTLAPATYSGQCATIIGQIAAGESYYTSQGNTPPPYGGGSSMFNPSAITTALVFIAALASPGMSQAALAGSGNATGQATVLAAQPGQNNSSGKGGAGGGYVINAGNGGSSTGAVSNTNGGNITAAPGAAGTGGSVAAGNPGYFQASPGGTPAVQLGIVFGSAGTSGVYGSLTPTASNYLLSSDNSTETTVNAPSGGLVQLAVAGTNIWQTGLYTGSLPALWDGTVTPGLSNYTLLVGSGGVTLNSPSGSGAVNFAAGGTTTLWTMQKFLTSDALYAGAAGAPGFTNFTIVGSATQTTLNSPSSDLQFAVDGVTAWDVNFISGNPAIGSGVINSTNYSLQTTATVTALNGPQGVTFAQAGALLWSMTNTPTSSPAIYSGNVSPSITNYSLQTTSTLTAINGPQGVVFAQAGALLWSMTQIPGSGGVSGLYIGSVSPSASNYSFFSTSGATVVNAPASSPSAGVLTFAVGNTPIFAMNNDGSSDNQLICGNYPSAPCLYVTPAGNLVLNSPNPGAVIQFTTQGNVTSYLTLGANGGFQVPPGSPVVLNTSNVVLSPAIVAQGSIVLTGTVTAAITVTFPNAVGGTWFLNVANLVLSGGSVTFKSGSGTFTTLHSTPQVALIVLQTTGSNNFITSYIN